jgi:LuxR family maltose regulon positive regulatory protein
LGVGEPLRALVLISLSVAGVCTARFEEADRHLEQGIALAHRIGRPFLKVTGLAHWARVGWGSYRLDAQRSGQVIELARTARIR